MVPIWDVVGSGGGRGSEVWLVHTNPHVWKWMEVSFGCHSGRVQGTTCLEGKEQRC